MWHRSAQRHRTKAQFSPPLMFTLLDLISDRVPKPNRKYLDQEPHAHINLFLSYELFEFEKKRKRRGATQKKKLLGNVSCVCVGFSFFIIIFKCNTTLCSVSDLLKALFEEQRLKSGMQTVVSSYCFVYLVLPYWRKHRDTTGMRFQIGVLCVLQPAAVRTRVPPVPN